MNRGKDDDLLSMNTEKDENDELKAYTKLANTYVG